MEMEAQIKYFASIFTSEELTQFSLAELQWFAVGIWSSEQVDARIERAAASY